MRLTNGTAAAGQNIMHRHLRSGLRGGWASDVTRDIRHAARGLWRSPGFSLPVILTLALAIGGNTAVFSVVDQLLLRPLPYPDGDQLVVVEETVAANPHA